MKIGINISDLVNAKKHKWFLNTNGYLRKTDKSEYLHQFIMGKKDGLVCDHINRNKLDNRKSNLRLVTHLVNGLNKDSVINAKGIYFDKYGKRYRACISVNNKTLKLGSFKTEAEAIEARKNAIIKYRN